MEDGEETRGVDASGGARVAGAVKVGERVGD